MEAEDPPAEVELLIRRINILERFADGPDPKRDAIEDLDCSRSTLDRAVRRLTDAELLERTLEGYVTTVPGQLAADRYREFLADQRAILDRTEVLSALPPETELSVEVLRGAAVSEANDDFHGLVEEVLADLRAADRYCAVLPRLADTRHLRLCHARVTRDALETTLVASSDLVDRLRREFPQLAAGLADAATVDIAVADLPSYGLVVTESDDDAVVTILVYDDDTLVATIRNDRTDVVDWAHGQVADLTADAVAATERLRPEGETGIDDRPLEEPAALREAGFVRVNHAYFENRVPNDPVACWYAGFDLVDIYYGHALNRTAPEEEKNGGPTGEPPIADLPSADQTTEDATDDAVGAGRSAPTGEIVGSKDDEADDSADDWETNSPNDAGRRRLAASLFERLKTDGHQVVVGRPGTGKSTLCRAVACRWVDDDVGDVLYRRAPAVGGIERIGPLVDAIERDDGHTLIVVEDAADDDVVDAMAALADQYRGDSGATLLLEAREDEWAAVVESTDPDTGPLGRGALSEFTPPGIDRQECRRAIEAFEAATGRSVALSAADLYDRVSDADGVGDLYLLGFHLAAATEPAAGAGPAGETGLDAAVATLYDDLTERDSRTEDATATLGADDAVTTASKAGDGGVTAEVGVLVAMLTGAGLAITPDLGHALAVYQGGSLAEDSSGSQSAHREVERALDRLEGQMLFGRDDGPAYRTHHPYWGVRFLERAAARDERRARALFERALSALFALADDTERQERIENWLGRESAALDLFRDSEAVADVAESIVGMAVRHSGLMPLFDTTERSGIDLPATAPPEVELSWISARLVGWHDQGALDRAVAEAELLAERAPEATDLDEDDRKRYVATAHGRLGEIADDRGDVETAREHFRAALSVAQEIDDDRAEIRHHNSLAWLAMSVDEYDRARDHLTTALELAGDEVFRYRTTARYYFGRLEMFRGDYAAAESHLRTAWEFDRELGDRQGEAVTLHSLGQAVAEQGDHERAERYYRRSLAIKREAGMRPATAQTRCALGDLLVKSGALDKAEAHLQAALETFEELGMERDRGHALSGLAHLERERGNYGTARERYRRQRESHTETDHDRGVAAADVGLGDVARDEDDLEAAVERYEAAYEQFRDINAPGKALDAVERLVAVARERGDLARAVEWCETGRDLATEAGFEERSERFAMQHEQLATEVTER